MRQPNDRQSRRQKREQDSDQQILSFTAELNERLAQIRSLRRVVDTLGPQRLDGVVELLERIAICSHDRQVSFARVSALAARIDSRKAVGERTIRRWAADAKALDLLHVDPRSKRYGGHHTNVWSIKMETLLSLIGSGHGPAIGRSRGGHDVRPGADTMSALTEGRSKKEEQENSSGSVQNGPATESDSSGRMRADDRGSSEAAAPGDPAGSARNTRTWEPPDRDVLRDELVVDHPLLRSACQRQVAILPPGLLVGNAFAPLTDLQLGNGNLVLWFRCQLSLRSPLTLSSEADLLLVLGAGLWAAKLPAAEVRKSRRAAFTDTILWRRWRRACGQLGAARAMLNRMLGEFPEALTHPVDLGPRASFVTQST